MFLLLYNFLLILLLIVTTPYLLFKWWTDKGYEWRQRLGMYRANELPAPGAIWIHAASMGEVVAAAPLIRRWRETAPMRPIFFTTMTRAGQARAKDMLPAGIIIGFLPFDLLWSIKRLVRKIQPGALLLTETELWFNLINCVADTRAPVYLINGRLSSKSVRRYALIRVGILPILNRFTKFFVQNENYKNAFEKLGVSSDKILITGNTKNDYLRYLPLVNRAQLRHSLGIQNDEVVVVAGSTRPGEEKILAEVIKQSGARQNPRIRWLIAPRHLNRLAEVAGLFAEQGIAFASRSQGPTSAPVILLDTMGELFTMYSLATIAFVGGTLVNFGGHNLFEPAAWAVPVIFGPYIHSCADQAVALCQKKGGWQVHSAQEMNSILKLIDQPQQLHWHGQQARSAVVEHSGGSDAVIRAITIDAKFNPFVTFPFESKNC